MVRKKRHNLKVDGPTVSIVQEGNKGIGHSMPEIKVKSIFTAANLNRLITTSGQGRAYSYFIHCWCRIGPKIIELTVTQWTATQLFFILKNSFSFQNFLEFMLVGALRSIDRGKNILLIQNSEQKPTLTCYSREGQKFQPRMAGT